MFGGAPLSYVRGDISDSNCTPDQNSDVEEVIWLKVQGFAHRIDVWGVELWILGPSKWFWGLGPKI